MQMPCLSYGKGARPSVRHTSACDPMKTMQARITKSSLNCVNAMYDSTRICKAFPEILIEGVKRAVAGKVFDLQQLIRRISETVRYMVKVILLLSSLPELADPGSDDAISVCLVPRISIQRS